MQMQMPQELNYGRRLTAEEYERRIMELHRGLAPLPTEAQDSEIRRRELNLAIDHRLGLNFPRERREALWAAQQKVEKKRLRLAFRYFFRSVLRRSLARGARQLPGYAVDEYAKVLSAEELKRFFNLREGEQPALPIDMDRL